MSPRSCTRIRRRVTLGSALSVPQGLADQAAEGRGALNVNLGVWTRNLFVAA